MSHSRGAAPLCPLLGMASANPLFPVPDSGGGVGVQPPLGTPVEHAQLGGLSPSAPAWGLACDAPSCSGLTGI